MGVTGERDTISASPETLVERARNAGARNVCVGIGVSTPEQGAKVGAYADGVIVGSALVHTLLDDDNATAKAPKEGLRDPGRQGRGAVRGHPQRGTLTHPASAGCLYRASAGHGVG